MKRVFMSIMGLLLAIVIMGCGDSNAANNAQEQKDVAQVQNTDNEQNIKNNENKGKVLVAYFSRTGENSRVGYIQKGNTEIVAEMIAEETEGDLFHIQTVEPYPDNYKECVEIAKEEKNNKARPVLDAQVENMVDYDVIFLGYPIWWSDMPMAVYTFMESYDLSGKTIIPFVTHEGSGIGDTPKYIADELPNSTVLSDGLEMRGQTAQNDREEAKQEVSLWLNALNLDK